MGRSAVDILIENGVKLSEDELAHFGVVGMRWGKRKKKSSSEDSGPPKPSVKSMSDDELKSAINRLKMEKEYNTLTAPQVNAGKKIVMDLLKEVGKQQAKTFINKSLEAALYGEAEKKAKDVVKKEVAKSGQRQLMKLVGQK